jgi:hypothetical protein
MHRSETFLCPARFLSKRALQAALARLRVGKAPRILLAVKANHEPVSSWAIPYHQPFGLGQYLSLKLPIFRQQG